MLPFAALFTSMLVAALGYSGFNLMPGDFMLVWYERAFDAGAIMTVVSLLWVLCDLWSWVRTQ